jgi:hypothetical protein
MKKTIPVLISILIFITGCSERKILKGAENYLKDHIGNSKSYDRIERKIADTVYLNEIKSSEILDSIRVENEELIKFEISPRITKRSEVNIVNGIAWHTKEEIDPIRVGDSINVIKTQKKIDSLKIISANLLAGKESSPIDRLVIRIRFRARMDDPSILTYNSLILYYMKTHNYEVSDIEYDGVEKEIDK